MKKERYQDYVIKNGKFIGEFNEMYKDFDDPWGQSQELYSGDISRSSVAYYIKKYNIKSCVEFGCGLGHTLNYVHSQTKIKFLGIDISESAIEKAKKSFPNLTFKVDSIENVINYSDFECIFFSQLSWYVLENNLLGKTFDEMKKNLSGKYFIHNLDFFKYNIQKYGNNYFTNLNEFINFCPFELIAKVEDEIIENDVINTSCIFKI